MLDGHNMTIERASVRLHHGDILSLGAKKTINFTFINEEFKSTYWIEYDKFINGERPKPDREWLRSIGCNVKALTAKKGALAIMGGFKIKQIKTNHDAEVKLRELEELALKKKLQKQKEHVLMLRNQMKKDYAKVKDANYLVDDLLKHRKLKQEEMERIEKQRKADEKERKRKEAELKEQQRLLREAEEAKRIAEQKSALAKHRLLGSTNKIVNANRMQSALEILREVQAEKLRQEAEEERIIEEARAKEEKRIKDEIKKYKKRFDGAIETGSKLAFSFSNGTHRTCSHWICFCFFSFPTKLRHSNPHKHRHHRHHRSLQITKSCRKIWMKLNPWNPKSEQRCPKKYKMQRMPLKR